MPAETEGAAAPKPPAPKMLTTPITVKPHPAEVPLKTALMIIGNPSYGFESR